MLTERGNRIEEGEVETVKKRKREASRREAEKGKGTEKGENERKRV